MFNNDSTFGFILGFVICLSLFELVRKGYFKWVGSSRPTHEVVKRLVNECTEWATIAQQDKSDLLALTHSNYAMSHYYALQQIATPEYIFESSGVKMEQLGESVKNLQQQCAKKVRDSRPDLTPPGTLFYEAVQDVSS